ncbi:hypothetical protein CRM22_002525 [Opisthorchis felineus]|uniref:DFDF domain-containing protein n=1 Tax=Opisthorchis felineus TaxID=147828 RepID=A0A4S2M5J5_OPIFE|nr:hypothetical protein CRM22_002525 [Opisthorchis felineus]
MQGQYTGFRVHITSSQLGEVVGTVCSVTENKIELSDAHLNGQSTLLPSVTVESKFIERLRILATGSGDSSDDVTPRKEHDKAGSSGRAQRREMLRNIPNTCNAYVCPDSPPVIHRSAGVPVNHTGAKNGGSLSKERTFSPRGLDAALASATLNDANTTPGQKIRKHAHNETPLKRRSYSMSEAQVSSGGESDSLYRGANVTARGACGPFPNGSRHHGPAHRSTYNRAVPTANHRPGGTNRQSVTRADWDQIRVEEFMDEDFDFEKNLAMFDKNAFYEMVDMQRGVVPRSTAIQPIQSTEHFAEGPDGVGVPLLQETVRHAPNHAPKKSKEYYDDCTMTTNTATLSSSKQRHEHAVPYYHPSSQAPPDSTSTHACICSTAICSAVPGHSAGISRYWHTPTGLRVPVLPAPDHYRMLHYLATGKDPSGALSEHPSLELVHGLSWGRLLETAGRGLVDHVMRQLRSSGIMSQRSLQRPPARILVLPDGPHLGGALAITLARLLAIRGACVLLIAPRVAATDHPSQADGLDAVYRAELELAIQTAPRPNPYGLEEDDQFNSEEGTDDEDEGVDDGAVAGAGADSSARHLLPSDGDSELASCLALDQLSSHPNDTLDYSPLNRMWISRMPGLKLLRRSTSVTKLPPNIIIDLVVLGHSAVSPHDPTYPVDSQLLQWLQRHHAITRVAYLMPRCVSVTDQYSLQNAPIHWVVELGLPRLLPSTQSDSLFSNSSNAHLLVDVGLSRNLIRRLTSDLKCLPPYGLFDVESVIPLKLDPVASGSTP